MILSYHEIREISPENAREISSLSDLSRRPKSSPKINPPHVEELVLHAAKETGFSYRRLMAFIQRKYSIPIKENTIKAILK